MEAKVKLEAILNIVEMQYEGTMALLHRETGNVFLMEKAYIREAEDGEPFQHLSEEEQEKMLLAYDIVENDEKYIELPSSFDFHEYEIVEDFCLSIQDNHRRSMLLRKIRGKGAFRRFRDTIASMDLEQEWYTFRDHCYRQLAIDFCDWHNLEYVE